VQVCAVHRLSSAGEGDTACLDTHRVDTDRAQLTLDDGLEARRRDREQVEPIRNRLSR
jgi:hypothetical protein